jgi:glycosyltransferase involved in cell wall biosynthesis
MHETAANEVWPRECLFRNCGGYDAKTCMSADVLYLTFDGLTDPLGRSQVLPYLVGLARRGHHIRIVSLEKPERYQSGAPAVEEICREAGISWHPRTYRSWPPIVSAIFNLYMLRRAAERLHHKAPADLVHCRSDLPGIVGLRLKRRFGVKLLYDMRAFWPDERAEGGDWDQSRWLYRTIFRFFKSLQQELLAKADEIIVLSEEGRRAVTRDRPVGAPITVIPCCADFGLFKPVERTERLSMRSHLGVTANAHMLIHVGSIGGNCLLDEMLEFFAVYREWHPTARLLFLAPSGDEAIRIAAEKHGVEGAIHVRSADREEVPQWIGAADIGIMFVRPVWAKKAACPTKLGEMIATGIPIIANHDVGDVAEILGDSGAGIIVETFNPQAYRLAIEKLERLGKSAAQIRSAGRRWFDLELGTDRYDQVYRDLASAMPNKSVNSASSGG